MAKIARITCIDPRAHKDGVYCWSVPGGIVTFELANSVGDCIARYARLELVTHTDCLKLKQEERLPIEGMLTPEQIEKLEARARARRVYSARLLLWNSKIRQAVQSGCEFCLGHLDVETGEIAWLREETEEALQREGLMTGKSAAPAQRRPAQPAPQASQREGPPLQKSAAPAQHQAQTAPVRATRDTPPSHADEVVFVAVAPDPPPGARRRRAR